MSWIPPNKWDKEKLAKAQALCMRTLSVRHFLYQKQREFYDLLRRPDVLKAGHAGLYCSRKIGKTFLIVLDAYEFAWRNPRTITRIVLPEQKQAREIVWPICNELKAFIPSSLWPIPKISELKLIFKNGSVIALGGATKENCESNRGPIAHRVYRDECAAWEIDPHFTYITKSILLPQMTTTGGMLIDTTTPPKSPTHPWIIQDYQILKQRGHLVSFDIDQNALLSPEQIAHIVERYGGRDNPDFRREYLVELISDKSLQIVPEFDVDKHVIDANTWFSEEATRSVHKYGVISADYGVTDNTGILAGVYVPSENKVIITKESIFNQQPVSTLATEIEALQQHLTKDHAIKEESIKKLVDCFEQAGITLRKDFGISYQRPTKRKLVDNVGFLRLQVKEGRVLIDKSCQNLISQLEVGIWKDTEKEGTKDFERTSTHGHFDLIHALTYLVRGVPWGRLPEDEATGMCLSPQRGKI